MPEISDEILAKLQSLAEANGLDLGVAPEGSEAGDEKPVMPAVSLSRATSEIAHETGLNLKDSGLYLYNDRLVTIDDDGAPEDMDSRRFRTWIDQYQLNYYKRRTEKDDEGNETKGAPIKATMKADVAEVLLRADEFRSHIPEITRIVPVSLPLLVYGEELTTVRMLPPGYDADSGIYCVEGGLEYSQEWELDRAVEYLCDLLKDYPFAEEGRSIAVQIAAMLTVYCQLFFDALDRWPMIYYNANIPGSGKSILAQLCIYPVYGSAEAIDYSDNDEFVKRLDTWCQRGVAYTFFDDVSGLVKNNNLNRWLTMPTWSGRIMHSQRMFSHVNQTLTLLTGNQATLSDDLGRRSLMVDLWSAELASDRQSRIARVIDAGWLSRDTNRADVLSALHALVMHWVKEAEAKTYGKLIPSFEGWSRIIPSIVTAAGFECPLQAPDVQDAGQKQEVEFRMMLELAIRDYQPDFAKPIEIRLNKWAALARTAGVFHSILADKETMREVLDAKPQLYKPVLDDDGMQRQLSEADMDAQALEYLDRSMQTKFSNLLHKYYRGQIRTINGRRYRFADREARHSTFALELLKEED